MENEFVSYEQAVALKELGFDEPCFIGYNTNKELMHFAPNWRNSQGYFKVNGGCAAPLKQQVFRWFRYKYWLEGVVERSNEFGWYKYNCYQYSNEAKLYLRDGWEINTYEEAEDACIDKLIELAKQQTI